MQWRGFELIRSFSFYCCSEILITKRNRHGISIQDSILDMKKDKNFQVAVFRLDVDLDRSAISNGSYIY